MFCFFAVFGRWTAQCAVHIDPDTLDVANCCSGGGGRVDKAPRLIIRLLFGFVSDSVFNICSIYFISYGKVEKGEMYSK